MSGVSFTSNARLDAMPGPGVPGWGRTKLSSSRLFIASQADDIAPGIPTMLMLMVCAPLPEWTSAVRNNEMLNPDTNPTHILSAKRGPRQLQVTRDATDAGRLTPMRTPPPVRGGIQASLDDAACAAGDGRREATSCCRTWRRCLSSSWRRRRSRSSLGWSAAGPSSWSVAPGHARRAAGDRRNQ